MWLLDLFKSKNTEAPVTPAEQLEVTINDANDEYKEMFMNLTRGGYYGSSYVLNYDGEKNLGGIGPVTSYFLDYESLRARSWKAYLDSEIAQTILGKKKLWVVGKGLKLQCEPAMKVLSFYGIDFNAQEFNDIVESRFAVFCASPESDFSGMESINTQSSRTYLDSMVGGDTLVILRLINNEVTVQMIDGIHVQNPVNGSEYIQDAEIKGNIIKNGIEIDTRGRHVAYYVRKRSLDNAGADDRVTEYETERILTTSPTSGLRTAFLVSGLDYRKDNVRSIPLLSAVMETISTLDRYKEATLQSAEEAAKIMYTVEHEIFSTNEDPTLSMAKMARGVKGDQMPIDAQGNQVAAQVRASTNKTSINMPNGAHLKSFTGGKELYFESFMGVNIDSICATVNIPPAVAMSKYDDSYSSSRAAIKDWENTLFVDRDRFSNQYYRHIYAFWLDVEILKGNINAPGYIKARFEKNTTVLNAYRTARFVGTPVPHIDPVKEVQAARLKLGTTGANVPLSTSQRETENLNSGEFNENLEQYAIELSKTKELGVVVEVPDPVKPAKPKDE